MIKNNLFIQIKMKSIPIQLNKVLLIILKINLNLKKSIVNIQFHLLLDNYSLNCKSQNMNK